MDRLKPMQLNEDHSEVKYFAGFSRPDLHPTCNIVTLGTFSAFRCYATGFKTLLQVRILILFSPIEAIIFVVFDIISSLIIILLP